MKPFVFPVAWLCLAFAAPSPTSAQTQDCPPGQFGPAELEGRIVEIVRQEGPSDRITVFVSRSLARRPIPGCTFLREDVDRQEAMAQLIRFAVQQDDPILEAFVLAGVREALSHPGTAMLEVPLGALAEAVEDAGSWVAAANLFLLADDPAVGGYLLRWARAESGPPAIPTWPEEVVSRLIRLPTPTSEPLRAALFSDLSLIRNPRARCLVENRDRHDHLPPVCPPS
jgi:hypothetical protein